MCDPVSKFALVCHPATPDAAVSALGAEVQPDAAGLAVDFHLSGELAALRIPDVATPLPPERLWAHTCFELFVGAVGEAAYREFNFSPNGQWMRFDFADYRARVPSPAGPAPRIAVSADEGGLGLSVLLPAPLLPAGRLCIGLTAVVEHADGSHTYWALRHPVAQPDFHHRDGFALALHAVNP